MVTMLHFQKIGRQSEYAFWLKFFQIPVTRTPEQLKLESTYPDDQKRRFWRLSSFLQSFVMKSVLVTGILAMSLGAMSYLFMSQKYVNLHSLVVFWTIVSVSDCQN